MNYLCMLLTCILYKNVSGITFSDLYPFGSRAHDSLLRTNDDQTYPAIKIGTSFSFFGRSHNALFVNINGDLTFVNAFGSYTPAPFPYRQNLSIIAVYWADVDTRKGGDVWYRQTVDPILLKRISKDIQDVFPQYTSFQASWMFIATWYHVAFFGADSVGQSKTCTFQCVLTTDRRFAFVVFLYNNIEWTTGTANGGNKATGTGGIPAQVGFDAGDGLHYYAVSASRTADIINITHMSNVGIPGKFIFRVDMATIEPAKDVSTRALRTSELVTTVIPSVTQSTTGSLTMTENTTMKKRPNFLKIMSAYFNAREEVMIYLREIIFGGYRSSKCTGDQNNNAGGGSNSWTTGGGGMIGNRNGGVGDNNYLKYNNDCKDEPCLFGECKNLVNGFQCECNFFFTSKRCSKVKTWVLITLLLVLIVLNCLCCFCCIATWNKYKKKSVVPVAPVGKKPRPAPIGRHNMWLE